MTEPEAHDVFPARRARRKIIVGAAILSTLIALLATTVTGSNLQRGATPSGKIEPIDSPNVAQAILDDCLPGEIVFRPPSPMRQGETEEFVLRAALADSKIDPAKDFPGEGVGQKPVEKRLPPVCEKMKADLSGPAFDIQPVEGDSTVVLIPQNGFAEWSWYITPKKSGNNTLTLRLSAPGPEGAEVQLEKFREDIEVNVGIRYVAANFVKEWAPTLGLTVPVVLGGGGVLFSWWWRKSYRPKHSAENR